MSARRKNARRLRDLRALGVPINGDYLVTDFALRYHPDPRLDLVDYGVRGQRRRVTRIDWRAQRTILAAASERGGDVAAYEPSRGVVENPAPRSLTAYVSPPGACDQCGDEAGPHAHQGCEACSGSGFATRSVRKADAA